MDSLPVVRTTPRAARFVATCHPAGRHATRMRVPAHCAAVRCAQLLRHSLRCYEAVPTIQRQRQRQTPHHRSHQLFPPFGGCWTVDRNCSCCSSYPSTPIANSPPRTRDLNPPKPHLAPRRPQPTPHNPLHAPITHQSSPPDSQIAPLHQPPHPPGHYP